MIRGVDAGSAEGGAEFLFGPETLPDQSDCEEIGRLLAVAGAADRLVEVFQDAFEIAPGFEGLAQVILAQLLCGILAELVGKRRQPRLGDLKSRGFQPFHRRLAHVEVGKAAKLFGVDPVVAAHVARRSGHVGEGEDHRQQHRKQEEDADRDDGGRQKPNAEHARRHCKQSLE